MQIESLDGPLPKDAITYTYEAFGRLLTRAINGAADPYTYDAVGRVTQEMNAPATFTYTCMTARAAGSGR